MHFSSGFFLWKLFDRCLLLDFRDTEKQKRSFSVGCVRPSTEWVFLPFPLLNVLLAISYAFCYSCKIHLISLPFFCALALLFARQSIDIHTHSHHTHYWCKCWKGQICAAYQLSFCSVRHSFAASRTCPNVCCFSLFPTLSFFSSAWVCVFKLNQRDFPVWITRFYDTNNIWDNDVFLSVYQYNGLQN